MARVLLVEDEPNIASIIVFKLEREGHQVRWEASASGVPAAADAAQPELVLLWTRVCRTGMHLSSSASSPSAARPS